MGNSYSIDISVLIIFFNRPGCLAQVWEQVKKVRPSRLFLYQDGVREGNEKDDIGVAKCREIVSDIDWDCEVHRKFQERNYGCDPSGYIARKWMFEHVDRGIILEDDCVPSQSFFPFCQELLERYAHDERIHMICGMNNTEISDTPYSYLFSRSGAVCGIAIWKRSFELGDPQFKLFNDGYDRKIFEKYLSSMNYNPKAKIQYWSRGLRNGIEYFESILGVAQYANHQLNIVAAQNMIANVGNTPEGGTHSTNGVETIPKGLRRIFTMPAHEIEFPLKHPPYVIEDLDFLQKLYRIMGTGHPWVRRWRLLEKAWLILRYEGFSALAKKISGK